MNRRDALPAFMTGWSASTLDAGYFHELWLYSKSPLNRVNYESAAFDRLIEQGNAAPDRARRIGFVKAGGRAHREGRPAHPGHVHALRVPDEPRVKGIEQVPLGLGFNPFRDVEIAR